MSPTRSSFCGSDRCSRSRTKGYEKIVDLRRHLVADLIALIEEKSTKQVPQASVEMSMQLLGELRAPEAVPTLLKHLIYPLGFDPNDKSFPDVLIGGGFLNSTPRDLCPAVRSLISIGPICAEAVVSELRKANDGSVEVVALIDVLKGLRSTTRVPDLQALLDASQSEKEKKNLRTAIRALAENDKQRPRRVE